MFKTDIRVSKAIFEDDRLVDLINEGPHSSLIINGLRTFPVEA